MSDKSVVPETIGLYRFYNFDVGRHGEPFGLCEAHAKTQPVPDNCRLDKLANDALRHCAACEEEVENV